MVARRLKPSRATAVPLPCYTAVARLGFKRRTTAVLKSSSIRSIEIGTAVARRLKRALTNLYKDVFAVDVIHRKVET